MNDALEGLTQPVTLKRFGPAFPVKGRFEGTGPAVISTIEASVQPANPDELQELPELERTIEAIVLYTTSTLRPVDAVNGTPADVVTWRGVDWKIRSVATHDEGLLDHFKVIAQRITKGVAVGS